MSDAKLFLLILMFFSLWTGVIAIINLSAAGSFDLSDVAAFIGSDPGASGALPGQVVPNVYDISSQLGTKTGIATKHTENFTSSGIFNEGNITVSTDGTAFGPKWVQSTSGYTSANIPFYPLYFPALIKVYGVTPVNNIHDVVYTIDNSASTISFDLIIYSYGDAVNEFINVLKFDENGVHLGQISTGTPVTGVQYYDSLGKYLSYPGAHHGTKYEIKYNQGAETADVYIDNNYVGQITGVGSPHGNAYYAGVATWSTGLTVTAIESWFSSTVNANTNGDWVASMVQFVTMVFNTMGMFLGLIGAALGWTTSPQVPFAIWAFTGIPMIAALIYLALRLWRGGG